MYWYWFCTASDFAKLLSAHIPSTSDGIIRTIFVGCLLILIYQAEWSNSLRDLSCFMYSSSIHLHCLIPAKTLRCISRCEKTPRTGEGSLSFVSTVLVITYMHHHKCRIFIFSWTGCRICPSTWTLANAVTDFQLKSQFMLLHALWVGSCAPRKQMWRELTSTSRQSSIHSFAWCQVQLT